MRLKDGLVVLLSFLSLACNSVPLVSYSGLQGLEGEQVVRFFYPSAGGQVEAYIARPRGEGPFPLVVLLHGHSIVGRGAIQVLPTAEALARENCFAGLAISLPGYGATEISAGPIEEVTQKAVQDGLLMAERLSWIDKSRVMFYGVSRGATVAAVMLNKIDGVRGSVLYSGAYDLGMLYRETSSVWIRRLLNPSGDPNPKLVNLLDGMSKWHAPTLILHGEQDKLVPVDQAFLLRDRLEAAGTPHRLVLYPDQGHFLPRASIREETINFLKETTPPACPVNG
jgi:dipeptidyl aminopeptidase/acylaminoacyl peptidase